MNLHKETCFEVVFLYNSFPSNHYWKTLDEANICASILCLIDPSSYSDFDKQNLKITETYIYVPASFKFDDVVSCIKGYIDRNLDSLDKLNTAMKNLEKNNHEISNSQIAKNINKYLKSKIIEMNKDKAEVEDSEHDNHIKKSSDPWVQHYYDMYPGNPEYAEAQMSRAMGGL